MIKGRHSDTYVGNDFNELGIFSARASGKNK